MKPIIAMLCALVFSVPAFAEDDYTYVGSIEDQEFFVLTDKAEGTAPRANKHGVVWADVIGVYTQTRNGHLKGGAHRATYGIDCEDQRLIYTILWTKRSSDDKIVWVSDELVAQRTKEAKFAPIKPNSLGAAVSDFACAYVSQPANPSEAPPSNTVPKSKGEFVPL